MSQYRTGIKQDGRWTYNTHRNLSDALRDAGMYMSVDFPHIEAVAITALDSSNNTRAVFKRPDPIVEAQ